ncbi:hypothetical protein M9458_054012, partial [Cirrhinus mrigala]
EEPGDLSGVPREYHDLRAVFSRSRSATLSPHRPYNCSIDLIPGSIPPRGKPYSLSAPEREAQRTPSQTRSLVSSVLQRTAITRRPFSPVVVWLGRLSGESSGRVPCPCVPPFFAGVMPPDSLCTLVLGVPWPLSANVFGLQLWSRMYSVSSPHVLSAPSLSLALPLLPVSFVPFLSRLVLGRISFKISLRDYLPLQ